MKKIDNLILIDMVRNNGRRSNLSSVGNFLTYKNNVKKKTDQILLNTNNVILDKLFVTHKLCSTFARRHFGHFTKILGLDSLDL